MTTHIIRWTVGSYQGDSESVVIMTAVAQSGGPQFESYG